MRDKEHPSDDGPRNAKGEWKPRGRGDIEKNAIAAWPPFDGPHVLWFWVK